ncbi:MAG: sigma-70 family RNA polymerase sigma factor [Myxococcales bacterium]|nr:sigma-70 family RNA polymerase sigma factor [Myxococcales bacterium]
MDAAQRTALNQAMARLARGERAASDEVFALLWPALKAFAARWLSGSAQAEDVAQQALVKVFRQAPSFDASKDALSWALEVTVWECRTERRRVARARTEGLVRAAPAGAGQTPEEELEAAELTRALGEAVAGLPQKEREEVAKVVREEAAGDAAARKRRQRALGRLKALWRALHGDA